MLGICRDREKSKKKCEFKGKDYAFSIYRIKERERYREKEIYWVSEERKRYTGCVKQERNTLGV